MDICTGVKSRTSWFNSTGHHLKMKKEKLKIENVKQQSKCGFGVMANMMVSKTIDIGSNPIARAMQITGYFFFEKMNNEKTKQVSDTTKML